MLQLEARRQPGWAKRAWEEAIRKVLDVLPNLGECAPRFGAFVPRIVQHQVASELDHSDALMYAHEEER